MIKHKMNDNMAIAFYAEDTKLPAIKKRAVGNWVKEVAATYGKKVGDISYIFCSDEKILEVNRQYLQHDYYTDIITFDYTSGDKISGDLFISLLPAGSITGAPKPRTVQIIREAETYDRGFYTSVTGYFDGRNLDSAVLIRFLEQPPDGTKVFKSGGGITFRSEARNEYEEMKQKVYVPLY